MTYKDYLTKNNIVLIDSIGTGLLLWLGLFIGSGFFYWVSIALGFALCLVSAFCFVLYICLSFNNAFIAKTPTLHYYNAYYHTAFRKITGSVYELFLTVLFLQYGHPYIALAFGLGFITRLLIKTGFLMSTSPVK